MSLFETNLWRSSEKRPPLAERIAKYRDEFERYAAEFADTVVDKHYVEAEEGVSENKAEAMENAAYKDFLKGCEKIADGTLTFKELRSFKELKALFEQRWNFMRGWKWRQLHSLEWESAREAETEAAAEVEKSSMQNVGDVAFHEAAGVRFAGASDWLKVLEYQMPDMADRLRGLEGKSCYQFLRVLRDMLGEPDVKAVLDDERRKRTEGYKALVKYVVARIEELGAVLRISELYMIGVFGRERRHQTIFQEAAADAEQEYRERKKEMRSLEFAQQVWVALRQSHGEEEKTRYAERQKGILGEDSARLKNIMAIIEALPQRDQKSLRACRNVKDWQQAVSHMEERLEFATFAAEPHEKDQSLFSKFDLPDPSQLPAYREALAACKRFGEKITSWVKEGRWVHTSDIESMMTDALPKRYLELMKNDEPLGDRVKRRVEHLEAVEAEEVRKMRLWDDFKELSDHSSRSIEKMCDQISDGLGLSRRSHESHVIRGFASQYALVDPEFDSP